MATLSRKARVLWSALSATLLIVVLFAGWYAFLREDAYAYHGGTYEPTDKAPGIAMVDQRGEPFKLSDHEGKVVLIYFGYTYCPNFCPTTMADMQRVEQQLGDQADEVEVVMVTVDPDRDTPARLGEYMEFFNPAFYGLSGTQEQTEQATRDYGVMAQKREAEGASQYLVDHSTSLFAIDPDGFLRVTWAHGTAPEDIASDVGNMLDQ